MEFKFWPVSAYSYNMKFTKQHTIFEQILPAIVVSKYFSIFLMSLLSWSLSPINCGKDITSYTNHFRRINFAANSKWEINKQRGKLYKYKQDSQS